MIKTGECYWRDEDRVLWLSESWVNEETGETTTVVRKIEDDA